MAHLFDNHPDDAGYETPPVPERKRRPWVAIAVAAAALAVVASGSAALWLSYGGSLPALPSFASGTEQSAPPAAVADTPAGLKDLQALQQQIAGPLQSTAQLLADQQAEIKRLADQIAVLTAKVELLERPPASAQASVPTPAPPSAAPAAARKRSAAPKQPAGISVGGAPLPPR